MSWLFLYAARYPPHYREFVSGFVYALKFWDCIFLLCAGKQTLYMGVIFTMDVCTKWQILVSPRSFLPIEKLC
jgi:hypothetical protein